MIVGAKISEYVWNCRTTWLFPHDQLLGLQRKVHNKNIQFSGRVTKTGKYVAGLTSVNFCCNFWLVGLKSGICNVKAQPCMIDSGCWWCELVRNSNFYMFKMFSVIPATFMGT